MGKRLGEILVTEGVIDPQQLQAALAEAALWGARVGEVLVSRGECDETKILNALAKQLSVEIAPLKQMSMIPERILRLVAAEFAREREVIPIALDEQTGVLEVALADPADHELLDELRFRTGHEIRAKVAMASEVADAVARFYGGPARKRAYEQPRADGADESAADPSAEPTAGTSSAAGGDEALTAEHAVVEGGLLADRPNVGFAERISSLERQVSALTAEVERLRLAAQPSGD